MKLDKLIPHQALIGLTTQAVGLAFAQDSTPPAPKPPAAKLDSVEVTGFSIKRVADLRGFTGTLAAEYVFF